MFTVTRSNATLGSRRISSRSPAGAFVRPSRRCARVVAIGLKDGGDWVASGSLNIFTPPKDAGVTWRGTSNGYPVAPRRHGTRGPGAQCAVGKDDANTDTAEPEVADGAKAQVASKGALAGAIDYIAGALQRVMGHNFRGDTTEPDWKESKTEGWTGDIRNREKDGFHNRKI